MSCDPLHTCIHTLHTLHTYIYIHIHTQLDWVQEEDGWVGMYILDLGAWQVCVSAKWKSAVNCDRCWYKIM